MTVPKVGQRFRHFDGKLSCICIVYKVLDDRRIHLKSITDYPHSAWWEDITSFRNPTHEYYYKVLPHYETKLGKILYK